MPQMTGYHLITETMRGYGVSHVFYVESILRGSLAEMDHVGITRVMTHAEKAAAYMADGFARAARRPGICMAQTIGASNLAAGLKDAYMACAPVIAITGGSTPETRYRYAYQEIEDFRLFDPVTKFNAQVDAVERLPDLLRQAFRAATTGTPRPVHLELLGAQGEVTAGKTADLEVVVEERFSRVPAFRPVADDDSLRAAARALARAERPVIVAGGGVAISDAAAEVVQLAELLNIPVATALNAKATIPEDHPLSIGVLGTYSRACANQLVSEADLVFFIGSHTGGQVTHFWQVPPRGTPVIQLDIDPEELGRNYPNQVSLLGDAQATLRRLIAIVNAGEGGTVSLGHSAWPDRAQELRLAWQTEHEPLFTSNASPMRPERICREIAEFLPPGGVVVSDTGHSGMWTGQQLELRLPAQRYIRTAGSLGWGIPGAMGVKCALPDNPVLCFTGDGGAYYHLTEMETAARHGINVVVLVNNNQSLNQCGPGWDRVYGGREHRPPQACWQFIEADFARAAEALGCGAVRVDRPEDLRPALERAFAANRPFVIDAISDIDAVAPRAWVPTGK